MLEQIANRRSVRKFLEKPVEKEKLLEIVKAGMQAPSAGNQQPWQFVIITEKETLNLLSKTAPGAKPLEQASAAIVILNHNQNLRFPEFVHQDLGACTQNILLEVVNQNLGAVWIGVAPIEERIKYVKNTLKLNDNKIPFNIIAIGYCEDNSNYFKDRFDNNKIIWE
ncbi:MAG TPA: nitroreductase family protein [Ignavibacteriales bacterium]|nr:nitroreductase family protein [Ignavibacteriales bacterium]HOL81351.1 nitroreductase family protein [Ignavibacteriales bacterium]HPP33880.1 nitroreductase family protein [Ignavibacteriales bacterium]HRR18489.1 nitroreductase family protein [Ignavibacteriales bacterium]